MTCSDQMGRHRPPHDAQPNEPNAHIALHLFAYYPAKDVLYVV